MKKYFQLIMMFFVIIVCGCESTKEESKPGFIDYYAYIEKEDGWIYDLIIEKMITKEEYGKISFMFGGVNLKYKEIKGYYVPIVDENGTEIDRATSTIPNAIHNPSIKEEVKMLNLHFDEKKFTSSITEEDIADLETQYFSKKDIITLVNNALNDKSEEAGFGKYNIPQTNCVQRKLSDGSIIQVSYSAVYGYIRVVNIEYIYPDGVYLSDLVLNKSANEMQIQAKNDLDLLEEDIVQKQEVVEVEVNSPSEKDVEFNKNLYLLINEVFRKK